MTARRPTPRKQVPTESGLPSRKRRRIVIPFRSIFKWLVRLRRSPRAVAGGFALGMFIAFTPTLGVQIALALFLATLINVNRPAALVTVWITNVATMVPIYTFNYWVGSKIFSGPPVAEVYRTFGELGAKLVTLEIWDLREQFEIMLSLSSSIFIPLLIGSFIVGAVAALLTYLTIMIVIRAFLRKRSKKRVL